MNGLLDGLLVGAVVIAAVGYAVLSLGPRGLRGRIVAGAAAGLYRLPRVLGLRGAAQRLASAATAKAKGACGGCDDCGSGQPAAAQNSGEVKIPLSSIGKRR